MYFDKDFAIFGKNALKAYWPDIMYKVGKAETASDVRRLTTSALPSLLGRFPSLLCPHFGSLFPLFSNLSFVLGHNKRGSRVPNFGLLCSGFDKNKKMKRPGLFKERGSRPPYPNPSLKV